MNLQCNPNLGGLLENTDLVLDTSALIDASKEDDFYRLLKELRNRGCSFVSINAVKYEFLRGASSSQAYSDYLLFLEDLQVTFISDLEPTFFANPDSKAFLVSLNSLRRGRRKKLPSYTDTLLLYLLYRYRNFKGVSVKLMTSNYEDVPLEFFKREELIVFEESNEVRTEAIYSFSPVRFSNYLKKLK